MQILIVDDESYSREKILSLLLDSQLSDSAFQEADDGINALKLCDAGHHPDIVFTDVKMPRMDGVELAVELRERYPACIIIFMSSYSDKDYLKTAINVGAVSYIEKPYTREEFSETVDRAYKEYQSNLRKLDQCEYNQRIRSQAGHDLLSGRAGLREIRDQLNTIALSLPRTGCFLTVLFGDSTYLRDHPQLQNEDGLLCTEINGREALVVFSPACGTTASKLLSNYPLLEKLVTSDGPENFAVLGNIKADPADLPASLEEARQAMNYRFFQKKQPVYVYNSIFEKEYDFRTVQTVDFAEIIAGRRFDDACSYIENLTQDISRCMLTNIAGIKKLYFKLLTQLIRDVQVNYPDENPHLSHLLVEWEQIDAVDNIFELSDYLILALRQYASLICSRTKCLSYTDRAEQLIKDNYSFKELSLDWIASELSVSPAYLSRLFTEEKQTTMSRYINDFRIAQAGRMLAHSDYKIAEIADLCGYSDRSYFSATFRKLTRLTPSQYREVRNNEGFIQVSHL